MEQQLRFWNGSDTLQWSEVVGQKLTRRGANNFSSIFLKFDWEMTRAPRCEQWGRRFRPAIIHDAYDATKKHRPTMLDDRSCDRATTQPTEGVFASLTRAFKISLLTRSPVQVAAVIETMGHEARLARVRKIPAEEMMGGSHSSCESSAIDAKDIAALKKENSGIRRAPAKLGYTLGWLLISAAATRRAGCNGDRIRLLPERGRRIIHDS